MSKGESFYIENTRGRSSHQHHPLAQLQFDDEEVLLIAYDWMVIIFCLHKVKHAEKTRVRLQLLDREKRYRAEYIDSGKAIETYGEELMNQGIQVDSMDTRTSEILRVSLK